MSVFPLYTNHNHTNSVPQFLELYMINTTLKLIEAAYKGLARPVLEYGSSVWDPHTKCLQKELEKVQNRAARFVTRNYAYEEGSMTRILEQLKWESLKKRRTDNRLILLYKGLKGKARIPTDDLIPKTRRCRNSHSKAFQLPSASIEVYKCSFFRSPDYQGLEWPPWLSVFYCWNVRWLCVQVHFTRENNAIWRVTSKLFRFRFRTVGFIFVMCVPKMECPQSNWFNAEKLILSLSPLHNLFPTSENDSWILSIFSNKTNFNFHFSPIWLFNSVIAKSHFSERPHEKYYHVTILHSKSLKKCHKKFENRLTNKKFMPEKCHTVIFYKVWSKKLWPFKLL